MPLFRPFLHALLCLALAANGIGAAMAGVHGTCDHARPATVASEAECHDHASAVAHASVGHHGAGHATDRADDAHGCCDDSATADCDTTDGHAGDVDDDACDTCFCGCQAHASAALPTFSSTLPVPVRVAIVQRAPTDHAAPALPHPTRPPIRQG
jgi:hypothetical protein